MTIKSSDIPTPNDGGPAFPIQRTAETFAMAHVEGGQVTKYSGDQGQTKRDVYASRLCAALTARMHLMNQDEAVAVSKRAQAIGATSMTDYIAKAAIAQADALINNLSFPPQNFDELNQKIEELTLELAEYKRLMPKVRGATGDRDDGGITFGGMFFSFDSITGWNEGPGTKRDGFYLRNMPANMLLRWANEVANLGKPPAGVSHTGQVTELGN